MLQRLLSGSMLPGTVFLLFLVLISVIAQSMYEDRIRGNLEEVYQKRAADRVAFECADVTNEGLAYCRNEVQELEARRLQEHLDLYAQQSMAASTFGVLLTSIVAVIVTLIGIVFVRETLRQTVAANEAAHEAVSVTREIGQAQVRAYLSIEEFAVQVIDVANQSIAVAFLITVKNAGQSPALDVAVKIDPLGAETTQYAYEVGTIAAGSALERHPIMTSLDERVFLRKLGSSRVVPLRIEVALIAKDVFGKKIEQSATFAGSVEAEPGSTLSLTELHSIRVFYQGG